MAGACSSPRSMVRAGGAIARDIGRNLAFLNSVNVPNRDERGGPKPASFIECGRGLTTRRGVDPRGGILTPERERPLPQRRSGPGGPLRGKQLPDRLPG